MASLLLSLSDTYSAHVSHLETFLRRKVKVLLVILFFFFLVFQYFFSRMVVLTWNRCCIVMFLVATLKTGTSQISEARPKANSIKPALLEESPTPATNRSATVHSGITKKYNILAQVILITELSEDL